MLLRQLSFWVLLGCAFTPPAFAQTDEAQPLQPIPQASAPVDVVPYETLTLPKDRVAAWKMVREANGLHGPNLRAYHLVAHYKTYDATGQPKGEGTLEYVWQSETAWHISYRDSTKVWTRWRTPNGLYAPRSQAETPGYPEKLILPVLQDPLGWDAPSVAPSTLSDITYSNVPLSCFHTEAAVPGQRLQGYPESFCTERGRPVLRSGDAGYATFFNQMMSFDHQIVAKQITVKDGPDTVLEIQVQALKSIDTTSSSLLIPPPGAELIQDTTVVLPPRLLAARLMNHEPPRIPTGGYVRGAVRLSVVIGADGHISHMEVLHSPGAEYTRATEEAVKHWTYQPYLQDGRAVEHESMVVVYFFRGR